MDQDYERALEQFEIASRLSPSNGDIARLIAAIKRRQGKWEQSLKEYERVAKLDPQNPNTVRELIFTNTAMRRWPEAARWVERLRAMAPASVVAKIQSGYVDFWWKGNRTVEIASEQGSSRCRSRWRGYRRSMGGRNAEIEITAAARSDRRLAAKELSYIGEGATPRSFFEGCIALAQGDIAGAQKYFEQARPVFENAVKQAPVERYPACQSRVGSTRLWGAKRTRSGRDDARSN